LLVHVLVLISLGILIILHFSLSHDYRSSCCYADTFQSGHVSHLPVPYGPDRVVNGLKMPSLSCLSRHVPSGDSTSPGQKPYFRLQPGTDLLLDF